MLPTEGVRAGGDPQAKTTVCRARWGALAPGLSGVVYTWTRDAQFRAAGVSAGGRQGASGELRQEVERLKQRQGIKHEQAMAQGADSAF